MITTHNDNKMGYHVIYKDRPFDQVRVTFRHMDSGQDVLCLNSSSKRLTEALENAESLLKMPFVDPEPGWKLRPSPRERWKDKPKNWRGRDGLVLMIVPCTDGGYKAVLKDGQGERRMKLVCHTQENLVGLLTTLSRLLAREKDKLQCAQAEERHWQKHGMGGSA